MPSPSKKNGHANGSPLARIALATGVLLSLAIIGTCSAASKTLEVDEISCSLLLACVSPASRAGWLILVLWGQLLLNDWTVQKSVPCPPSWLLDPLHPPCWWEKDDHQSSLAFLAR